MLYTRAVLKQGSEAVNFERPTDIASWNRAPIAGERVVVTNDQRQLSFTVEQVTFYDDGQVRCFAVPDVDQAVLILHGSVKLEDFGFSRLT